MGSKIVMMVVMVMVVALFQPLPTSAASILTAFSRGFERQEEIQTTLLNKGSGWESREVPGKMWVCTGQQRDAPEAKVSNSEQLKAFVRLFDYLDGKNSEGEELPMGKPVSIEVKQAADGSTELNACFFLPERVQANPPAPTNPLVYLSQRPTVTIFTNEFGGFATDEDTWMKEAQKLKQRLTEQGKQIRDDLQYWNAYDPPHKFWFRRNEVWLVAAEQQQEQN